jgi:DNA-binding GntR family transcriptional regulator
MPDTEDSVANPRQTRRKVEAEGVEVQPRRTYLESIHVRNLSEQVADKIVQGICNGRFQPGERLIETEIATELQVSRIPVRSALKALEKQGIVISLPHRGARVMALNDDKVQQLFEVRLDLERRACRGAIARLRNDAQPLERLDEILKDMRRAVFSRDKAAVVSADIAFHRWICETSQNQIVMTLWDALSHHLRIVFGLIGNDWPYLPNVYDEHKNMRDAFAALDEAEVERMLTYHLHESFHRRSS